jgi:hypothetical protein
VPDGFFVAKPRQGAAMPPRQVDFTKHNEGSFGRLGVDRKLSRLIECTEAFTALPICGTGFTVSRREPGP